MLDMPAVERCVRLTQLPADDATAVSMLVERSLLRVFSKCSLPGQSKND
jgi:hypothetical protein